MKRKTLRPKDEEIKKVVREGYARIAQQESSCCGPVGTRGIDNRKTTSKRIGYTDEELKVVPEGANLGLGCGNPVALASLREGEVVLDLGSGAGFDCFLAAQRVGEKGRVIGVDMTPEMIDKARKNAKKGNYKNVEFRLGEIENLPVADDSVDLVISNCVINLSPDKERVFQEAFRVLRPGGRMIVSDIVLLKKLPALIKNSIEAYVGCLLGAILRDEYLKTIRAVGFQEVEIMDEMTFPLKCITDNSTTKVIIKNLPIEKAKEFASSVLSIKVYAAKPN
jgi:SAM-dependent methyltransferase